MRIVKTVSFLIILLPLIYSCSKDFNVNAEWEEITLVYGILNQNDSVHNLKITKAFLGPGNAMEFAKIPDSSNFPDKLDVRMEEWDGTVLKQIFLFDTITIHDKEKGDSIFYYPDQLMYQTSGKLNEKYTYKIFVKNKQSGKEITAQTQMIHYFKIEKPLQNTVVNYDIGNPTTVKWYSAKNGKRYQLVIRFHYTEVLLADTSQKSEHFVDWVLFNDKRAVNLEGNDPMEFSFPSEGFYQFVGSAIQVNPDVARLAGKVDYIFTVGSDDLNTYMEVTQPSSSLVQEKPFYTNITNGIGLFTSRYDNTKENPRNLTLSPQTKLTLKTSQYTSDLGF